MNPLATKVLEVEVNDDLTLNGRLSSCSVEQYEVPVRDRVEFELQLVCEADIDEVVGGA